MCPSQLVAPPTLAITADTDNDLTAAVPNRFKLRLIRHTSQKNSLSDTDMHDVTPFASFAKDGACRHS